MNDDEQYTKILRELGEIKAGQMFLRDNLAAVRSDLTDIRAEHSASDERLRRVETALAEYRGTRGTLKSAVTGITALVSGIVSAVVAAVITWMVR